MVQIYVALEKQRKEIANVAAAIRDLMPENMPYLVLILVADLCTLRDHETNLSDIGYSTLTSGSAQEACKKLKFTDEALICYRKGEHTVKQKLAPGRTTEPE